MTPRTQELLALRAKHDAYMARWKQEGKPFLAYEAPCCGTLLETTAPSEALLGQVWDSLCTCPNCGALFLKWVDATEVSTRLIDASCERT
ncbi:hypothetical protein [Pseudoxanthomonas winnipegensis]|uniref:hypothetical protein n=1 Tax=Pseudoxanthomonas winnipegensis TaxID=2480810 RepID=UPI001039F136|nr:hypothetical protein [Pseudoxanthomonas winnipegensis]TBV76844.1 hypothetical protein EYC45_01380 [Pseudoxanthomonas winnipegensis]